MINGVSSVGFNNVSMKSAASKSVQSCNQSELRAKMVAAKEAYDLLCDEIDCCIPNKEQTAKLNKAYEDWHQAINDYKACDDGGHNSDSIKKVLKEISRFFHHDK